METPIEQLSLKTVKEYLKYISLKFSHIHNLNDNIFSCDTANGDTFKGFFLTANYLKRLLCNKSFGWLDELLFTLFATMLNFSKDYNMLSEFNDNLPSLVFADTQYNAKIVNIF